MTKRFTRREMLRNSAMAGVGSCLYLHGSSAKAASSNEKLNIACIGLGNQGNANLQKVAGQNIVALCDVDDSRTAKYAEKFPKARRFADFRVMFDKMEKEIDAVVVTTPNHTHAPIAIGAMRMGKHC